MRERAFLVVSVKQRSPVDYIDIPPATSCMLRACLMTESSLFQMWSFEKCSLRGVITKPRDSGRHGLLLPSVCLCLRARVCDSVNMKGSFIVTVYTGGLRKTNISATNPNNPAPKMHKKSSQRFAKGSARCLRDGTRSHKMGRQRWHCDVQGALGWSARPKLKPWNMSPYCYLCANFFKAPFEKGIEI